MKISDICKSYFSGFQEIYNLRQNDKTINALALLKILSYFTVVIPLGFAAVYGAASLYGRVSKKQDLSSHDKSINDKARTHFHFGKDAPSSTSKSATSTVKSSNEQLAEKIIAAGRRREWNIKAYVETNCSGKFLVDPSAYLVHEMIERGVGRSSIKDGARAFVISRIPDFIEKVSSPTFLRSVAEQYFEDNPDKFKILQVFEKSLLNEEFQRDLKSAVDQLNVAAQDQLSFYSFYDAERSLRIPLTIYHQSAKLEEYSHPAEAGME